MRRNSISFTATEKVRAKNKSRKTEFSLRGDETDEPRDPNATLFETLMNDPVKRAMVMELINTEKEAIEEYKQKEKRKQMMNAVCQSPVDKFKRRYAMESPTALLRRRALEMREKSDSGSSCSERTHSPSPKPLVPFERLLENVVAFVEVRSRNEDRSDGVKALLRNMGATVVDTFTRDVTHVIFKDGSFLTYQKAKLMKKHLVSVLWLETIRTTGCRAPERSYPALGTANYDNNVTLICEKLQNEYTDVVKEEMRKTVTNNDALSQKTLSSQQNQIALLSQLSNLRTLPSSTTSSDDFIPNSQDMEVTSFTSKTSSWLASRRKTPDSMVLPESDAESDCGVVNGYSYRKSRGTFSSDDSEHLRSSSDSSKPSQPDKISTLNILTEKSKNTPRINKNKENISSGSKSHSISSTKNNRKSKVSNVSATPSKEDDNSSKTKDNDEELNAPNSSVNKKKRRTLYSINQFKEILNLTDDENTPSENKSDLIPAKSNKNRKSKVKVNVISAIPSKEDDDTGKTKDDNVESNNVLSNSVNKKKRRTLYSINNFKEILNLTDDEDAETTRKTRSSMYKPDETHTNDDLLTEEKVTSNVRRSLYKADEKNKRRTVQPLQTVQQADVSLVDSTKNIQNKENNARQSLESNARKVSLESITTNVSEELGVFVTRRKPRKAKINLDKDGFKIPDESINLSILTDDAAPIGDSLTEKETETRISTTSTEGHLSSLRISDTSSAKKSLNSVELSPLVLSSSSQTDPIRKSSFSPPEKINNSDSITNLITHLESSNTSNELLNVSTTAVRGRRKTKTTVDVKNNNILGESKRVNIPKRHHVTGDEESSPVKRISGSDENSNPGKENVISTRKSVRVLRKTTPINKKVPSSSDENSCPGQQNLENVEGSGKSKSGDSGKKKRKLYNPNNSYSDLLQLELIEQVEKEELARKENKTISVPITPILLTARSKTLIENKLLSPRSNSSDDDDEEVMRDILKTMEKTSKVKKSKKKVVQIDSQLDEQKDLIKEFVEKKTPRSQKAHKDSLPIKPQLNRRSTMDFMPKQTPTPKKGMKAVRLKRPSIVCTRFHRNDVQVFQQIVKKLGHFVVENDVTDRTTHLIVAEIGRTINVLRAIARGIWVLRAEWLYTSLESGKWLPEEDYELISFSPAVQQCRIERQTFGSHYSMDVFANCGPIYVARSTNPRCSDLEELITLGKGTVVNSGRGASICVGEALRYEGITCVEVKWVLDCVTFNVCKPFDDYILQVPKLRKSEHF